MKPDNLGLIFYKGIRPLYFTAYREIKEDQTTYLEVDLATGGQITIYPYWSKKQERIIEAREAIYRYPRRNNGEEIS